MKWEMLTLFTLLFSIFVRCFAAFVDRSVDMVSLEINFGNIFTVTCYCGFHVNWRTQEKKTHEKKTHALEYFIWCMQNENFHTKFSWIEWEWLYFRENSGSGVALDWMNETKQSIAMSTVFVTVEESQTNVTNINFNTISNKIRSKTHFNRYGTGDQFIFFRSFVRWIEMFPSSKPTSKFSYELNWNCMLKYSTMYIITHQKIFQ